MLSIRNLPWRDAARQVRGQFPLVYPAIGLAVVTVLLTLTVLDLSCSGLFFDLTASRWPHMDQDPWETIDRFFIYPGVILGIASLVFAGHCLVWRIRSRWIPAAAIIGGTFLMGPGIAVNGTMKPFFSRPRPREIVEFAGPQTFRPPLGFGDELHFNSSFPSGHASIGFFLMAPAFAFRRDARRRYLLLAAGLGYGALMSFSRIIQGGHFLSDVLWSLGVIYFSSWLLTWCAVAWELRQQQQALSADLAADPSTSAEQPRELERRLAA